MSPTWDLGAFNNIELYTKNSNRFSTFCQYFLKLYDGESFSLKCL